MIFELQIDTDLVGNAVNKMVERDFLTRVVPQLVGTHNLPFDGGSGPGLIDHVSIGSVEVESAGTSSLTHTVTLPPLFAGGPDRSTGLSVAGVRVRVVLVLHAARRQDLIDRGFEPVPAEQLVQFQVRLTLVLGDASISGTRIELPITLREIEIGQRDLFYRLRNLDEDDVSTRDIRNLLVLLNSAETLASLAVAPLATDLGSVISEAGPGQRLWNAAARIMGGGSMSNASLVLGLQIDPADTAESPFSFGLTPIGYRWTAQWTSFHARSSSRVIDGDQWALFLPGAFMTRRIDQAVTAAMDDNEDLVLHAHNPPHSEWQVTTGASAVGACDPAATIAIRTIFSAAAKGACEPWGGDMDVNITINSVVTMPRPGTLRVELEIQFVVDHGDAAACAIGMSFITSHAGGLLGGIFTGFNFIGMTVGAFIGGLIGGWVVLGGIADTDLPPIEASDIHPVEGTTNRYYTEVRLPIPRDPFFGPLTPARLIGCTDGLTVAGSGYTQPSWFQRLGTFRIIEPWRWLPETNECPPSAFIARSLLNGARPRDSSSLPLTVWSVQLTSSRGDAYAVYTQRFPHEMYVELKLTETAARALRDAAAAAGLPAFPIDLEIQTNAGARIMTVPSVGAALTDADLEYDRERRTRECEARRNREENLRERAERFIDIMGERLPPHLPEPGPGPLPPPFAMREWTFVVAGVHPDEKARITRRVNGASIEVDTFASRNGTVRGRLYAPPDHDLAIELSGGRDRGHAKVHIILTALDFEKVAEIPLTGGYQQHELFRAQGRVQLAATTTRGTRTYDLHTPALSRLSAARAPHRPEEPPGAPTRPLHINQPMAITAAARAQVPTPRARLGDIAVLRDEDGKHLSVYQLRRVTTT